jgi:hypothetical protein
MTKGKLRFATLDDFIYFYGHTPKYTIKAWVYEHEGVLLGIGGIVIYRESYNLFLKVNNAIKCSKKILYHAILQGMNEIKKTKLPYTAIRDCTLDSSKRLLEKLGFQYLLTNTDKQEVYVWQVIQ